MVLQSGVIPYQYAHGGRRFEAKPIPIGISGILLEQAQFVITAELRKWLGVWHQLPDFNVYVNTNIVPSGPYEPKPIGTTLDNLINPGAAIFIDNVIECRAALNLLLFLYASDTDFTTTYDYRKGWLQALWPESPSGFLTATDPELNTDTNGQWRHRFPSETGNIDYCSDEVLGSSGILYDIDFAEVMFNPAPHIGSMGFDDTHNKNVDGTTDDFNIQQYPIFPAFQKTDGSIITLTGREPVTLSTAAQYNIEHVSSGCIRLYGYMLKPLTEFYLSREQTFDNVPVFSFFSEGIRAPFSPNVDSTVAFLIPTAQASGVYRIAARNRFFDYNNGTIESGSFSQWPAPGIYWPSDFPINSTTTRTNEGYHIFDDNIWMTDRSPDASFGGPNFGYPSGLSILSPFTGHRLWVRYADMNPITINIPVGTETFNWSTEIGLERVLANTIYRILPLIQRSAASPTSGQVIFAKYNDTLDFISSAANTSTYFTGSNEFPLGGDTDSYSDMWFDGTNYWILNNNVVGFDMWQFDSTFQYVDKYGFNSPTGINGARGSFVNGQNVLYYGFLGGSAANFAQSGIFPINIVANGTDPFDNTATIPLIGQAEISFGTVKYINGETQIGVVQAAEIMDLFEVISSTHTIPGIYAIVRFGITTITGGNLYLLRIEETATSWEIRALTRLETTVGAFVPRREILHMAY